MREVLVTGGAGYVGCVLVPELLQAGYRVTVYDHMLYGAEGLYPYPNLEIIEGDIRDTAAFARAVAGMDAVIHLACISNDPSFELDPAWSRTINYDCFGPMVRAARKAGVGRFIYASSSSVYGVSDAPEVTEDHPLVPLTDYNRYKGLCEPVLLEQQSADFTTVIVRPATLCGYSPRMRFDLTVNILTNHAVNRGVITVMGGKQMRPNLHIDDMVDLYLLLLHLPAERIAGETFNISCGNHSVRELADKVQAVVEREFPERGPIDIVTAPSNDPRSYRVTARKVTELLGFAPSRSVEDAIQDLCRAFRDGVFRDSMSNDRYLNVQYLKQKVA